MNAVLPLSDEPAPSLSVPALCACCLRRLADSTSALILDAERAHVAWRGRHLPLTAGEIRVLQCLVRAAGAYCRYRALYDVIQRPGFSAGAGDEGWRNNVRSMVKRLRHKFLAVDPGFTAIVNYTGFGYAWRE